MPLVGLSGIAAVIALLLAFGRSGLAGQWLDTEAEQAITTETLVFGSVRATPHPYAAAVPITWLALRQPAISMVGAVMSAILGVGGRA